MSQIALSLYETYIPKDFECDDVESWTFIERLYTLLICSKDKAQNVKEILKELKEKKSEYL